VTKPRTGSITEKRYDIGGLRGFSGLDEYMPSKFDLRRDGNLCKWDPCFSTIAGSKNIQPQVSKNPLSSHLRKLRLLNSEDGKPTIVEAENPIPKPR
jgi:hypothetical protein